MVDRRDYVALEWVKGEIVETLKQARQALDEFDGSPASGASITACLACIHQVHGSLQMVEFYGAALLAEEMEQLALALQQGRVAQIGEAIRLLQQAFGQLPLYLDRIHSARRDLPLVVLPLLNDLRSARGESLLSETSLFSPNLLALAPLDAATLAARTPAQLPNLLRKWRQMLQAALVGLLREQDGTTNLGYMAKVFSRLEALCEGAPLGQLWQVASALVEGMLTDTIGNSPALRSLLKEADKELKRLLDHGMAAVNQPAPEELLKSLLFYIAKAERPTAKMLVLKERYGLDEALPDSALVDEERAHLAGPDRDAMRSVIGAVCEELVRVKERLDLFVRSDRQRIGDLDSLLAPLRQIADTLAVLGFGQPRKVIIDQLAVIQGLAQGLREPNDAVLMDVAGALLYVEATLAGMVGNVEPSIREDSRLPTTDLTQIHQLVIKEARVGLQEAKEAIIAYVDADWDREQLQPLPGILTQVRGALAMIPLVRPAALLAACNSYVRERLLGEGDPPDWEALDSLADALSSIEYYLERMGQDHQAPGEGVLDVAEQSLVSLGYAPAVQAQEITADVPLLDEVLSPSEAQEMFDLQALDQSAVVQSLAQVLANPVSELNPPARQVPDSLLPPPQDETPIDDELREVFLEETAEVLTVLREQLPIWVATPGDADALAELRRAFHTLKGSGRMVRALIVGELAWALENLLNRVLEHSVEPGPQVRALLEEALGLLPDLIDEFADNAQRQRADVDHLAARAHALARAGALSPAVPVVAEMDPQLLEIFRNEAQSHLDSLNRFLEQAAEHLPLQASDELLRALHTLKGSASMAGVLPIAALAAPLDHLVREFKAHLLPLDLDEVELLLEAEVLLRRALRTLSSEPLTSIEGAPALIARTQNLLATRLDALLRAPDNAQRTKRDPQLIADFLAQGMDILLDAESLLLRWQQHPGERQELSALLDELSSLGQSAHLADLYSVDELCEALLDLYGAVEESSLAVSERFFAEVQSAHEALINMLDQLAAGQEISPQPERVKALRELLDGALDPSALGLVKREGAQVLSVTELGAATQALEASTPGEVDEEIVEIFLEEAVDILDSAAQALQRWLDEPDNPAPLTSLQRDLHTLKGGARMAGVGAVGDLAHELESLYGGLIERRFRHGTELAAVLQASHDRLTQLLEQLQQRQTLAETASLVARIRALRENHLPVPAAKAVDEVVSADPELLDIFLEEGVDILESSGAALQRWQAEPRNRQEVENLLRDLHTLKGGARMVEIAPIGDLAHELEFLYEGVSAGHLQPGPELFELSQDSHDRLGQMLDAVRAGQPIAAASDLIASIRQLTQAPGQQGASALPLAEAPARVEAPVVEAERVVADMVKVPAELLEDLVNLAGETSILRGRIEQQANDAQVALGEMETTIERMRDQLRRLDIETQGRILSRQQVEAERQDYEEFDPLEMDRHSQLQQLSRALFESASDLLDLKETLGRRNQDASHLLLQQARVNTDLQEGLMRTRMVPFERILPRLKRIVRQVAGELGKDVEFEVINAESELDRNILERMVAPLEHMLRNAVDHGLETGEARRAAGKPEQGRISLELEHEGGDIVFDLRDDGAGISLEAVRRKAIQRGLLDPAAQPGDREVLQFILQPGFSTAEKVTQISGRGVGMDVVHEEVRQLGGSMSIDSVVGQGVHFRIRLPFSVSVNQALMVQCAEEQYAIPLNTVDGIVRVLPGELDSHYQQDPPRYCYGGQTYDLRYLGELLHTVGRPKLLGQSQPLPVLLLHSDEQRVAVQVDSLVGTREIVVKSLGPQFAAVQGLSGATLLGDGRVVLILDLLAHVRLIRPQVLTTVSEASPGTESQPVRAPLVLVVDDSVTVRKVTSRLLERHGMNVLTAKDGVDAIAVLQEHMPDLMLLDIEMPRMDGFEVAIQVRNDPRLKHLPIIMITSRTGQKHRDRAMAIGVNDYLGKPYQESVLLESIALWSNPHA